MVVGRRRRAADALAAVVRSPLHTLAAAPRHLLRRGHHAAAAAQRLAQRRRAQEHAVAAVGGVRRDDSVEHSGDAAAALDRHPAQLAHLQRRVRRRRCRLLAGGSRRGLLENDEAARRREGHPARHRRRHPRPAPAHRRHQHRGTGRQDAEALAARRLRPPHHDALRAHHVEHTLPLLLAVAPAAAAAALRRRREGTRQHAEGGLSGAGGAFVAAQACDGRVVRVELLALAADLLLRAAQRGAACGDRLLQRRSRLGGLVELRALARGARLVLREALREAALQRLLLEQRLRRLLQQPRRQVVALPLQVARQRRLARHRRLQLRRQPVAARRRRLQGSFQLLAARLLAGAACAQVVDDARRLLRQRREAARRLAGRVARAPVRRLQLALELRAAVLGLLQLVQRVGEGGAAVADVGGQLRDGLVLLDNLLAQLLRRREQRLALVLERLDARVEVALLRPLHRLLDHPQPLRPLRARGRRQRVRVAEVRACERPRLAVGFLLDLHAAAQVDDAAGLLTVVHKLLTAQLEPTLLLRPSADAAQLLQGTLDVQRKDGAHAPRQLPTGRHRRCNDAPWQAPPMKYRYCSF
eukprot:Rhum_TRINITY_DN12454_c0_g1::Rhum_TRINITY_DN12454_c0_g1_i1::g.52063::m.52063